LVHPACSTCRDPQLKPTRIIDVITLKSVQKRIYRKPVLSVFFQFSVKFS
jgi:hypothetical protein